MGLHIGKIIKQVFEDTGITVTELARRIKTTRQNVYGIFERSSIDTALLQRIGKALGHDFFQYYIAAPVSKVEEPSATYKKRKQVKRKIVLQIELEDDVNDEVLKLALGEARYKALSKAIKKD